MNPKKCALLFYMLGIINHPAMDLNWIENSYIFIFGQDCARTNKKWLKMDSTCIKFKLLSPIGIRIQMV